MRKIGPEKSQFETRPPTVVRGGGLGTSLTCPNERKAQIVLGNEIVLQIAMQRAERRPEHSGRMGTGEAGGHQATDLTAAAGTTLVAPVMTACNLP
jgi:NAD(P)H-dependent flavin oxidoreductase YrpB (nitropropane dioxygenase family)